MAFERLSLQVAKPTAPAGVTISVHGKVVISVRKDLALEAGFSVTDSYRVLLGTDEDAGKLRIVLAGDGSPCAREMKRTGAFFFNIGVVPAIGTTPHQQRKTNARIIDDGIEVDLPPDDGPKLLPPPERHAQPGQGGAGRKPAEDPKPAVETVTLNGVTICQQEDHEFITFKGDSVAVSDTEAKLLYLLARPRPAPVGVPFLIDKVWETKPRNAELMVSQMANGLKKSLAAIGLTVNFVKGAGYQLKDL